MERIKRRRMGAQGWRELLAGFAGSGLTTRAFCQRAGVSPANFYRWRTLLRSAPDGAMVRSVAAPTGLTTNAFVDLGALNAPGAPHARFELRLDLGSGLMLHLVRG